MCATISFNIYMKTTNLGHVSDIITGDICTSFIYATETFYNELVRRGEILIEGRDIDYNDL